MVKLVFGLERREEVRVREREVSLKGSLRGPVQHKW